MTARVYWARFGDQLERTVTENDSPVNGVDGDSILRNLYRLPNPPGQLWERIAEGAAK